MPVGFGFELFLKLEKIIFQIKFKFPDINFPSLASAKFPPGGKEIFQTNYFIKKIMKNFSFSQPPPNGLDKFNVSLVHKFFEFYKLFHEDLRFFPKTEKYSLGTKIETLILEMLDLTAKTVRRPKEERLPQVKIIDEQTNFLKILVRLASEIRALDNKKYLALEEKLQEIGRMIGGWLRSLD